MPCMKRRILNHLPADAGGIGDKLLQVLKYDVFGDVGGREPKVACPSSDASTAGTRVALCGKIVLSLPLFKYP